MLRFLINDKINLRRIENNIRVKRISINRISAFFLKSSLDVCKKKEALGRISLIFFIDHNDFKKNLGVVNFDPILRSSPDKFPRFV